MNQNPVSLNTLAIDNPNTSIPEGWYRTRLSRVVNFKNGADYRDVESDSSGYPVYGSGGRFKWASEWLYDGPSVLFGRKGTIDRPLYVNGKFWTVDTMYYTVPNQSLVAPKFLYYWATRIPFAYYATDTALPSMTQGDLGSEELLLPPLVEQQQIADYLDHETAEIDALIGQLVEVKSLLSVRRRTIIDDAFTRTGHPQVALKYLGVLHSGLTLGKRYEVPTQTYPYLRVANVQAGHLDLTEVTEIDVPPAVAVENHLEPGDVLLTEGGDRDKLGRGALWRGQIDPILHQNHVFAFRCNSKLIPEYLVYALESTPARIYFDQTARQSTNLASTNSTVVKNFKLPSPPTIEQRSIVERLDREMSEMCEMLHNSNKIIDLARERRAALITAAVTGQIDVTAKHKPAAEQLEDDIAQGRHRESA